MVEAGSSDFKCEVLSRSSSLKGIDPSNDNTIYIKKIVWKKNDYKGVMMSILIKNIYPPDYCNDCPLSTHIKSNYNSQYIWCPLLHGCVGDATLALLDRPSNCPIEPLPPNLIDVDKFKEDYHMGDDCPTCSQDTKSCEYDRIYSKMDFCSWLDDAERSGV